MNNSNYMPNFGYNNGFGNYNNTAPTFQQQAQQQNYYNQPQATTQPSTSGVYGRVVDNYDMMRLSDIPINGFGVFPQSDFGAVYIKYWTKDGTDIKTFVPAKPMEETAQIINQNPAMQTILEKINQLDAKMNSILQQGGSAAVQQNVVSPQQEVIQQPKSALENLF